MIIYNCEWPNLANWVVNAESVNITPTTTPHANLKHLAKRKSIFTFILNMRTYLFFQKETNFRRMRFRRVDTQRMATGIDMRPSGTSPVEQSDGHLTYTHAKLKTYIYSTQ